MKGSERDNRSVDGTAGGRGFRTKEELKEIIGPWRGEGGSDESRGGERFSVSSAQRVGSEEAILIEKSEDIKQAFMQSEERYRLLAENTSDTIWASICPAK